MRPAALARTGLLGLAIAASPAAAADGFRTATPRPADLQAIRACLGTNTLAAERRRCIGIVSGPCQAAPDGQSTMGMQQCQSREFVAWDRILNDAYRAAAQSFDESGKAYLRDVQTVWIKFRDQSCDWPSKVYPGGTISGPLTGDCLVDETANRALTLLDIEESMAPH